MEYQTPGVYTVEKNAFPNSVVEVATAIPAFIGYTAKADFNGLNMSNKPVRVNSLKEFEDYFGQGATVKFSLLDKAGGAVPEVRETRHVATPDVQLSDGSTFLLVPDSDPFYLYNSVRLFYLNGGATCYVTSIGLYQTPVSSAAAPGGGNQAALDKAQDRLKAAQDRQKALDPALKPDDPTVVAAQADVDTAQAELSVQQSGQALMLAQGTAAAAVATVERKQKQAAAKAALATVQDELKAVQKEVDDAKTAVDADAAATAPAIDAQLETDIDTAQDALDQEADAAQREPLLKALQKAQQDYKEAANAVLEFNLQVQEHAQTLLDARQRLALVTAKVDKAQQLVDDLGAPAGGAAPALAPTVTYERVTVKKEDFLTAIDSLEYEQDPTMLVCPDALLLSKQDYYTVAQYMLMHCKDNQNRVALLDVYNGAVTMPQSPIIDPVIKDFREGVGQNYLNYGAAYFPWVKSAVLSEANVSFANFSDSLMDTIRTKTLSQFQRARVEPGKQLDISVIEAETNTTGELLNLKKEPLKDAEYNSLTAYRDVTDKSNLLTKVTQTNIFDLAKDMNLPVSANPQREALDNTVVHNAMKTLSKDYMVLVKAIMTYLNTLPPAAAMAGVYTAVDTNRGVWKAPANVSLNGVVAPTVSLSDKDQGRLNIDAVSGKSINAIRPFPGLGTLVWGARTLDGNSQDWRYINVRRTMIMIEQSIKLAARAYVFEPNDANTWTTVRSMINNFLFNLWKQGALAGGSPDDAYSVQIGLGSTMTADDILNGYMNVTVLLAIVRPAEFIVLTFQQQMQKS
ncbi:phage tail sheath family protein [Hymenobacter chitinivorans]|uniref:Tail sheath protein n=1 Tax=Hymenobacter chitinivorans DSM 11115 TaxID=1121954 RepID=A0A2M9BS55_9BACT|nr:phage tail sheath C-terminal domain-containing protein [Hymenobacter chitinivorans]PJJ60775.1 tail sheath protein [Hymenobacter chitinivorans DSM 11115]